MVENKRDIIVIGHRGANSIAPENTLKAFQKAIELNADCIEFDLHETKDGELVIIHDENTANLTGIEGIVKEMTLEKLKLLDFGEGEKIPTLLELLELAKGKIQLNCEIKVKGVSRKIIEILHEFDMIESTIISSFIHEELLLLKKLKPTLKLGSLEPTTYLNKYDWNKKKEMIEFCIDHKLFAIHPLYRLVDDKFIQFAHDNNIKVFPWTVDSKTAIRKLIRFGVDGIISNDISKVQSILNE